MKRATRFVLKNEPPTRHFLTPPIRDFNSRRSRTYVVVVIQLDHGGIGARTQTFHFPQREQTVFARFSLLDAEVLFDGGSDLLSAIHHTGCRTAELNEVLPHLLSAKCEKA
jgi:hypothetical protein